MDDPGKISVIIPTYNRENDTNTAIDFKTNLEKAVVLLTENARQLLDFLLKQFYTKAEIKNG